MNIVSKVFLIFAATLTFTCTYAEDAYEGILSDFHSHVKGGIDLDLLLDLMDESNVDSMLIMRRDSKRFHIGPNASLMTNEELADFRKQHPKRIRLGIGLQIESWFSQSEEMLPEISELAKSGNFNLVGEIVLQDEQHDKHIPPSSKMFRETLRIAAKHQLPVIVHQFNSTEDDERDLLDAFRMDKNLTVVWAHMCGFSKPGRIREMFNEFPNLNCDLAWLPKKKQIRHKGVVDSDFNFTDEWKQLIETYPTRFVVGVDLTTKKQYKHKYAKFIRRIRIALGGLKPDVARKVASENFHRILM